MADCCRSAHAHRPPRQAVTRTRDDETSKSRRTRSHEVRHEVRHESTTEAPRTPRSDERSSAEIIRCDAPFSMRGFAPKCSRLLFSVPSVNSVLNICSSHPVSVLSVSRWFNLNSSPPHAPFSYSPSPVGGSVMFSPTCAAPRCVSCLPRRVRARKPICSK